MVAIIGHSKVIRTVLNYNEQKVKKGKAQLIVASKFGCDKADLNFKQKLQRFEKLLERNLRAKTNTLHISLNFAKGEEVPTETMQHIANEYMAAIGFADQPYLVYRHNDAAHQHMHIVTSLIAQGGVRINTHNIGRLKSEPARKALEAKYNLMPARTAQQKVMPVDHTTTGAVEYGTMPTKDTINKIVSTVIRNYRFTSIAELNAVLSKFGIIAQTGKEGSYLEKVKGLQFQMLDKSGKPASTPIKASSLTGKPTLKKLEQRFRVNEILRRKQKHRLIGIVARVLNKPALVSPDSLQRILQKWNIDILYRINQGGLLYGVTFIDHTSGCVFNGSDLGKEYSAKALREIFAAPPPVSNTDSVNSIDRDLNTDENRNSGFISTLLDPAMNMEPLPSELDIIRNNKKKKKRKLKR